MNERWQPLKHMFQEALDMPAEARPAFLADACGHDQDLRQEVDGLLRAYGAAGSFLETPAAAILGVPPDPAENLSGKSVGAFRILEEVGCGGMGAVYRARRDGPEYTQDVAFKVVPAGPAAAQFDLRFRQERRILAALEHPNIARLIDGGNTNDGRPYFAMEFVDGLPIDGYCDEHRLTLRERLTLFRTVCDAVAYANRKLIVHRDLKPTNILVASGGTPKLLDFGIAKLLTADEGDAALTRTGFGLMTPEFASPEQVRGDPVTTATDVYALGVLLYLLVTGRRPYAVNPASVAEAVEVICHEEPKPPSSVKQDSTRWRAPGDLDTIALKALRKEPDRRYSSAAELSDDIRRYLAGLPVQARPDTIRYRAARFVGRHRAAVAAIALAFLFLAGGLVATIYQARVAEANRQRADKRFQDVRRIANSLVFELHDSIADLAGATHARALLLKRGSDLLDTLAADAPTDPVLAEEVASAYHRLGEVLYSGGSSSLDERTAAIAAHQKGLAIRQHLAAKAPADLSAQDRLAGSHITLSYLVQDAHEALSYARRALAIESEISARLPDNRAYQLRHANAHFAEAAQLVALGDVEGGIKAFAEVAGIYERMLARAPGDATLTRNAALAHKRLGAILVKAGRLPEALRHYQNAVDSDERRVAQDRSSVQSRYDLSVSLTDLGTTLGTAGNLAGQVTHCARALELREKLAQEDPANAQAKQGIVSVLVRLGNAYTGLGRPREALSSLNRALAISQQLGKGLDLNTGLPASLAQAHFKLENWDEAVRWQRVTVEGATRAVERNGGNAWQRADLAWAQLEYADIVAARATRRGRSRNAIQRDWATALTAYQAAEREAAALEGQRSLVGRDATIPARAREGASACRAALTDYAR